MRRRLTTLRSKSGGFAAQNGNGNGNPRALVDESVYREFQNFVNWQASSTTGKSHFRAFWEVQYSGWSHGARPRDFPIFIRPSHPVDSSG
jgi:hypothetical protein